MDYQQARRAAGGIWKAVGTPPEFTERRKRSTGEGLGNTRSLQPFLPPTPLLPDFFSTLALVDTGTGDWLPGLGLDSQVPEKRQQAAVSLPHSLMTLVHSP